MGGPKTRGQLQAWIIGVIITWSLLVQMTEGQQCGIAICYVSSSDCSGFCLLPVDTSLQTVQPSCHNPLLAASMHMPCSAFLDNRIHWTSVHLIPASPLSGVITGGLGEGGGGAGLCMAALWLHADLSVWRAAY
jgi:hypothetical protein